MPWMVSSEEHLHVGHLFQILSLVFYIAYLLPSVRTSVLQVCLQNIPDEERIGAAGPGTLCVGDLAVHPWFVVFSLLGVVRYAV